MFQEQGEQGEKIASIKTKTKNCTLTCQPLKSRETRGTSARSSASASPQGFGLSSSSSSSPQGLGYGFGNSSDLVLGNFNSSGLGLGKNKGNKLRLDRPYESLMMTNAGDFNSISPISSQNVMRKGTNMDEGGRGGRKTKGKKTKGKKTKRKKTKRRKTKRRKH
jgi:hypothetical protein